MHARLGSEMLKHGVDTQTVDIWKHATSDSELQNPSAAAVRVDV